MPKFTLSFLMIVLLCFGPAQAQDEQQDFNAEISELGKLSRQRKVPVQDVLSRAEALMKTETWKTVSDGKRFEIIEIASEAIRRGQDNKKAMEYLAKLEKREDLSPQLQAGITLLQAQLSLGTADKGRAIELAKTVIQSDAATAIARGQAYMVQARAWAYASRPVKAVELAESALMEYDKAVEQGSNFSYDTVSDIKWTGALSRDTVLDYARAMRFFEKMQEYTDGNYWAVPAQLEMALTYRKQGAFEKAMQIYENIEQLEEQRFATNAMLPKAEMVLYDLGDTQKGSEMMRQVLESAEVHHNLRYRTLLSGADKLARAGQYEAALKWYSEYMEMPHQSEKTIQKYKSTILYRMGRIYQSMNEKEKAKAHYRKAMAIEGGDMDARINARNALERIEYFE